MNAIVAVSVFSAGDPFRQTAGHRPVPRV